MDGLTRVSPETPLTGREVASIQNGLIGESTIKECSY
jgi:hypothetical protein